MNASSFYMFTLIVLALIIPVYLYRVAKGPDVFDRLIGLNGIATKAVLFLVFIGAYNGNIDMFLDLAIGYTLLTLIGSLAVGKYLETRGLRE